MTLLEVLAATVVIGIAAAALTPMLLRASAGRLRLEDRLVAQAAIAAALDQWRSTTRPPDAGELAVAGHPAWTVRWEALRRTAPPIPGTLQIPRQWWRITVVDQQGAQVAELVTLRAPAEPAP